MCICGAIHSAIAEQRSGDHFASLSLSLFFSRGRLAALAKATLFYRRGAISIVFIRGARFSPPRLRPRITRTVISLLQCVYAPLPARLPPPPSPPPLPPSRFHRYLPLLAFCLPPSPPCVSSSPRARSRGSSRGPPRRSPSWTTLRERAFARGGKERRDREHRCRCTHTYKYTQTPHGHDVYTHRDGDGGGGGGFNTV